MPSKKSTTKKSFATTTAAATAAATTNSSSLAMLRTLLKDDTDGSSSSSSSSTTTATLLHQLGIGGLDMQVKTLLRRALASRLLSADMSKRLGVKHVRGILLHGPPGTGKTLIARQLASLLHAHEPKLISGPELLSMWVGKSEENIRSIFADAEREYKQAAAAAAAAIAAGKSPDTTAAMTTARLHVIIFDEIDALTRKRGGRSDTSGVMDSCVNQLLSKIDGLQNYDNILVIGTTNRKDLLDEALLRPGRLEVHVEVGLPDEKGREQIFRVHTRGFQEEGCLAADVDFVQLARLTPNFTGAEIEGLVKGGLSFALQRQLTASSSDGPGEEEKPEEDATSSPSLRVSMLDFLRALREAKPHYGAAGAAVSQQWARYQRLGFVTFRPEVPMLVDKLLATLDKAATFNTVGGGGKMIGDDKGAAPPANNLPLITILLQGPAGAGKTALLAKVASMANRFTFRRYLSGQELVGLGDDADACDVLVQAVQDAHQCPRSLLLLDDLEALVQYIPFQKDGAGRVSSPRLHTLLALLGRTPAKVGRVAVVLATTSLPPATLQQLGIWSKFSLRLELPLVETGAHVEALLGGGGDFVGENEGMKGEIKGPWTVREVLERQALGVMGGEKIEKVEEQVEEGQ